MKNVKNYLDVISLSKNGKVLDIVTLPPGINRPNKIPSTTTHRNTHCVLEVKGGVSKLAGLKKGGYVLFGG